MSTPQPARALPQRVTLPGRYVDLEPIARRHGADIFAASSGPGVPERYRWLFTDAPASVAEAEDRAQKQETESDPLVFAVIDRPTGRALGQQALMRIVPKDGVIEIGGIYWGPDMARSRRSTEAFYLHARHIFDDLGFRRFEWKCNNRNEPSKAAALRFGFTFEGMFRQHMIAKGENRDTAWFSMLDGEWPAIKARLEAWLTPENFDGEGRQRRKLGEV